MTETQAKSEAAGAPANPDGGVADKPATGRAVVGRASVPADSSPPKFTRAAGMTPPPDRPAADQGTAPASGNASAPASVKPVATATVPVIVGGSSAGTGSTGWTPGTVTPGGPAISSDGNGQSTTEANRSFTPATGAPAGAATAAGSARVSEAVRAARSAAASRGPRRARLTLKRIDPWSVMKFSFAVSLVLFIVMIVATSVLYLALDAMGVFESLNGSLMELISAGGGQDSGGFKITAGGVIGTSALIGLVNVVLFTALATLGAFIYNVCADLVGGVEVTLAERE